jgi:hypothetical protein
MLNLESFVHRDDLVDIIARWMVNHPQTGDVARLKVILNFNYYATRVWLCRLAKELLMDLHGQVPRHFEISTKGVLKDFAVTHLEYRTPRIEEMIERYRRFPEDFYRETPMEAVIYLQEVEGETLLMGTSRVKRFRRIAEKGARRIVDYMFKRIRRNADVLAEERARKQGIPKSQLLTSEAQMVDEFLHAERRVLKSIKQGTIKEELSDLAIPDVAGIKVIVDGRGYQKLLEVLENRADCDLVETEKHSGDYNAVNLKVSHRFPKEVLLNEQLSAGFLKILGLRGFNPPEAENAYRQFIATADDRVFVEIIVANFEEFLESEIGRSMHEERVIFQRANQDYQGHLATNVRYLMQYIFALCLSASFDDVEEVPVKLWVKYMPDTIERLVQNLFVPDDFFYDSFHSAPPDFPPLASLASVPAGEREGR